MRDFSRTEIDAASTRMADLLRLHADGKLTTERARDAVEQMIAGAAGQMSDDDRRDVAAYSESVLARHWTGEIDSRQACDDLERVMVAAAADTENFLGRLLRPGPL